MCTTGLSNIPEISEIENNSTSLGLLLLRILLRVTEEAWQTEVKFNPNLCSKVIYFKLDTGADVTVDPSVYFRKKMYQVTVLTRFPPHKCYWPCGDLIRNSKSKDKTGFVEDLREL